MWKWAFLLIVCVSANCVHNSDCPSQRICSDGSCSHKDLLPISLNDAIGAVVIFFISSLAGASGQGGSPLIMITLLVIFDFSLTNAIPLSQLAVLTSTMISTIMRIHLRHPTRDRPAIDYEFLLLIITPLLLGTTIGVFIEQLFPTWSILGILTILLIWITFEALLASYRAYAIENKEKLMMNSNQIVEDENLSSVNPDHYSEPLKNIIRAEALIAPPWIVSILLLVYGFDVISSLIRGSHDFGSIAGIKFCSGEYWEFSIAFMCVSIIITVGISVYLTRRTRKKINVGYNFDDFDIIWRFRPCLICTAAAGFAGFSSGLVSIGGGIVMSPIMLKIGLRPQIVIPTSSFIKVLTSSLAVVLYIISGQLSLDYAIWIAASALSGSIIGVILIKRIVKKFQRASIMVFCMAGLLGICTFVVPTYAIINYSNVALNQGEKSCTAI